MKNYLIIFDIDGTLTNSVQIHQQCYQEALEAMDVAQARNNFSDYLHHTDRYIFREIYHARIGQYPSQEHIAEFYTHISSKFNHSVIDQQVEEIEGARSFISHVLNPAGVPYVFATGSILEPALQKLAGFEIDDVTDRLAASDDIDSREDIVTQAVKKAQQYYNQQDFEHKIILGDGIWDYLTAQKLSMSFLGIGNNPRLKTTLHQQGKDTWNNFSNRTLEQLLQDACRY